MSFSSTRLQRVLNDVPVEFRLGDYISRGFQFMNQNFGLLLAFMLLSGVIGVVCQVVPVIGIVLSILIGPVLQIGYSQFAYATTRGQTPEFGEFFKGFNKIGPLLVTYLLTAVIGMIALLPGLFLWYQAGMVDWIVAVAEDYPFLQNIPDLGEMVDMTFFWLGVLAMMAAVFAISLLFSWSLNIVWFFEVTPMEALAASRKLIARNWLSFVAFVVLSGLIAGCGVLLCGIGLLYTAPAMTCAQFFAFADSARLFEGDGEDQPNLIDHFIA